LTVRRKHGANLSTLLPLLNTLDLVGEAKKGQICGRALNERQL